MKLINYQRSPWRPIPLKADDPYGPSCGEDRTHTLELVAATGDFDAAGICTLVGTLNSAEFAEIPLRHGVFSGATAEREVDHWHVVATIQESDRPRWPMQLYNESTGEFVEIAGKPNDVDFADFLPRVSPEMISLAAPGRWVAALS